MSIWVSLLRDAPFDDWFPLRCEDHADAACDCCGIDERRYMVDVAATFLPTVRLSMSRKTPPAWPFGRQMENITVFLSLPEARLVANALLGAVEFANGYRRAGDEL